MAAAEVEEMLGAQGDASLLMRSIDWAATPLGPVNAWSETLRTMVRVLLGNRFPLSLWWGPRLVQLYNDAYRPILGDKHPRAMAQPASDCFSETWDVIGPMIEAPFRGESATASDDLFLLLERKGFLEETHFRVAYSPVPDKAAATGVGGVLGICVERTEQVYAERQLGTLRELSARAADAQTAEQVCANAAAALAKNAWDVPFALLYLLDATGKTARRVSNVGFGGVSTVAAPASIDSSDDAAATAWPLSSILRGTTRVIDGIDARLGALPSGRWSIPPHTAVALALESPEQRQPYGVLICGVSPHRVLDDHYRGFFELAAAQIATAIRSARARALTRGRAEAFAQEAERSGHDVAPLSPRPPLEAGVRPFEADVRILVADHDVDMRDSITRTLRKRWTVMAVADGDAALVAAREWQPELVITEVLMHGLSGFGLLNELRKDARTRACSVMLLSAGSGDSLLDGLEAGASDYLTKPFSARELIARVSTQVQLARLRKSAEAERARLFSFLMQLPVAIAACEGPNHVVTLKNPLVDPLTEGRLRLGGSLSDICLEFPLEGLVEVLDRVYSSGEPAVWREQPLSSAREDGSREERLYDVALQPLRDPHGTVSGVVAAAYEVAAPLSTRHRKQARRREVAAVMAREWAEELAAGTWQSPIAGAPVSEPALEPPVVTPQCVEPTELGPSDEVGAGVAPMAPWPPGASTPECPQRSGEHQRVLVVDDDPDAVALLEEALVELGFSVAVAYDGPSALRVAEAFHPDTALVDVGLPSMDGFELGRRLRDSEAAPGALRLVAITGYGRESDRLRSQQAGFDLHLVKPVALHALSGAVVGVRQRRCVIGVDDSGLVVNDHGG